MCGKASEQVEECQEDSVIPESPTSVSALMELLAEMRLSLDRCPFTEAIFIEKAGVLPDANHLCRKPFFIQFDN